MHIKLEFAACTSYSWDPCSTNQSTNISLAYSYIWYWSQKWWYSKVNV